MPPRSPSHFNFWGLPGVGQPGPEGLVPWPRVGAALLLTLWGPAHGPSPFRHPWHPCLSPLSPSKSLCHSIERQRLLCHAWGTLPLSAPSLYTLGTASRDSSSRCGPRRHNSSILRPVDEGPAGPAEVGLDGRNLKGVLFELPFVPVPAVPEMLTLMGRRHRGLSDFRHM